MPSDEQQPAQRGDAAAKSEGNSNTKCGKLEQGRNSAQHSTLFTDNS
jgi:hypothetical protein